MVYFIVKLPPKTNFLTATDLILKLLEFNQLNRISASEALSHPYFTPFPTGMFRIGNSNDFISEAISKYNQYLLFSLINIKYPL